MKRNMSGRRDFLAKVAAVAATLPAAMSTRWAGLAAAAAADGLAGRVRYDPAAKLAVTVTEVELRRNAGGRMLMARVYRPAGAGPFPAILDLHGGAWNTKDRFAEEPMDRAIAGSGVLVVAVDLTRAPEAPYPASVQDANYAVRWLKWKAPAWNGDSAAIGIYGSSSGGHVAELLAMRPRDPRYGSIPLPQGAPHVDSTVAYVAMRSPISDPVARYENAERLKRNEMVRNHTTFFKPWYSIHESNPVEILQRHEAVTLVPMLVMQGALDDNMLPSAQKAFTDAYQAAGGDVRYELFEGCEHEWVAKEGPQTDRAREMVKAFIAAQLKSAGRS
jgi:acetyl esterase/lipase